MSKLSLNVRPFNLRLKHPFGISRGSINYANNVLITLTFDEIVAYGESAPVGYYEENQNTVIEFINAFKKHKQFEEYITNIQKLKDDLNNFTFNIYSGPSPSARAGIEIAFWDLIGKINNKSLYQFFFQDDPFLKGSNGYMLQPTSYTIGLDQLPVIKEKVKEAIKSGYKILKVKLGLSFDEDLKIMEAVGSLVKEHSCKLRVDANGGWDIETLRKMIKVLEKYNVEILEQPLPRGQAHLLREFLNVSPMLIFIDEDCMTSGDIESLAGIVHGINIKLMKSGSIIETFNMINLAKSYNLKVMLGCMIESSCAISACAHLSPLAHYIDLDGHLLLEQDPFCGLMLEDNKIIPSFDVGLGVSLLN